MGRRALFLLLFVVAKGQCATPAKASAADHVDWDSFGFGLNGVRTNAMWLDRIAVNGQYSTDPSTCLVPLSPLPLSPTCTILNYGQGLFEGLKAFRRNDGKIALFRPYRNALRMLEGAERFMLQPVPLPTFLRGVESVVRANEEWIPPYGKGALYLRPILFGSGEGLGVGPSVENTFCIYCSPVGNYFKGSLEPISLQAVQGYVRAAPGGSGGCKAAGNYAPAFLVQQEVRARGYHEALFLDAATGEAIEEAGASNFFAVFPHNTTIVTPSIQDETILEGVTRASIIELAEKELGYTVIQGRLTLQEVAQYAEEAFCCGTGASVTPIGSISSVHRDDPEKPIRPDIAFGDGRPGPITQQLYDMLREIQMGSDGLSLKYSDWIHVIDCST